MLNKEYTEEKHTTEINTEETVTEEVEVLTEEEATRDLAAETAETKEEGTRTREEAEVLRILGAEATLTRETDRDKEKEEVEGLLALRVPKASRDRSLTRGRCLGVSIKTTSPIITETTRNSRTMIIIRKAGRSLSKDNN